MTRQDLFAVYRVHVMIAEHEEYLRGLRELTTSIQRVMHPTRSCGHVGLPENQVVKIMTAEETLARLRDRLAYEQLKLREKILAETADELHEMLISRYVDCLTWGQVAMLLQLPRSTVFRQNKNFLQGLAEFVKV